MDIIDDILHFFGPPDTAPCRSMDGKSPMKEGISRFVRRLGFTALLAAEAAAFYVGIVRLG